MAEKKGGIAEMIIGMGKSKDAGDEGTDEGAEKSGDQSDSSDDPGLMTASDEIMEALDSKDSSALVDALRSFIEQVQS